MMQQVSSLSVCLMSDIATYCLHNFCYINIKLSILFFQLSEDVGQIIVSSKQ